MVEPTQKRKPVPAEPRVREQLLIECQVMAKYALAAGMRVPEDVIQRLDALEPTPASSLPLPSSRVEPSGAGTADVLTRIHNRLAELVAPATPKTILLLAEEERRGGRWSFLGAVPLIRRLMSVAIVSMVGFVWVSLSENVDGSGFDLLRNSGYKLLLSELFLLFAASVGASFANLFEAQRYIKNGTFDPKYESSYWVRYVLGLMAGTILALLIPIEGIAGEGESTLMQQLGKPMLALLGGFSASAVYRILSQIVSALESLVQGDTRDLVAAQEQVSKARLAEQETQNRMHLSAKLITLEQQLGETADPATVRRALKDIQRQLVRGESGALAESDPEAGGMTAAR